MQALIHGTSGQCYLFCSKALEAIIFLIITCVFCKCCKLVPCRAISDELAGATACMTSVNFMNLTLQSNHITGLL